MKPFAPTKLIIDFSSTLLMSSSFGLKIDAANMTKFMKIPVLLGLLNLVEKHE